jgi:hypothetical protein
MAGLTCIAERRVASVWTYAGSDGPACGYMAGVGSMGLVLSCELSSDRFTSRNASRSVPSTKLLRIKALAKPIGSDGNAAYAPDTNADACGISVGVVARLSTITGVGASPGAAAGRALAKDINDSNERARATGAIFAGCKERPAC